MAYWTKIGATEALQMLYPRILGRTIDASGLVTWRNCLVEAHWSMHQVIKDIGKHTEMHVLFDDPFRSQELWGFTIRFMYQQLLARSPENVQVELAHSQPLRDAGFYALWCNIVDSSEYQSKWGEEGVLGIGKDQPPGTGGHPPQQPREWQLCIRHSGTWTRESVSEWGYTPVDAAITYRKKARMDYVEPNPCLPW